MCFTIFEPRSPFLLLTYFSCRTTVLLPLVIVPHIESAIFLNATTQKFFQQIGALEEIMSHAKLTNTIIVANEDRKVEYTLEFVEQVKLYVLFAS